MKKLILLGVGLLSAVLFARAQAPAQLPMDPNVRYGTLENGLTYYVRHNVYPENRADFYIAQRVGSMQEEDSQAGLAHFLEHMAFNGSKNYPGRKNMLNYLEKQGAKFGVNVNAYTSFDETVYNLSNIPLKREAVIDSCLLILHDWSGFLELKDEEIDKERLIIKEEWRTRGNAQQRTWEAQLPIMFKDSKYANRLPIGSMDVVDNFEYQVLKDYYHKWYRPDLQAIIVVGDVDAEKVEAKIKTMFADIPKPENAAPRIYHPVPDNDKPLVSVYSDKEATSTSVFFFKKHDVLPPHIKNSDMGLIVQNINNLISKMISDRLSEIVQKPTAPFAGAYGYDGAYFVSKTKNAWTSYAKSKDNQSGESLATLIRENERAKRFGFTVTEFERAKAWFSNMLDNAYNNRNKQQNSSYIQEYVNSFVNGEIAPGIEYEYNLMKKILPMLTVEQVNEVFSNLMVDNKNIVIAISGPEKEGTSYPTEAEVVKIYESVLAENIEAYAEIVSDEPLISDKLVAGKVIAETKNDKLGSTTWRLSNGMKVSYKKTDFKDDEIQMTSTAYGGSSLIDDEDIYNVAMAQGVPSIGGLGNFNATDLKKQLAGKRATVYPSVGTWQQGIVGSSNKKDLETMLQLTYLHFTAPRKDAEAFEARLSLVKDQLKNKMNNPQSALSDSLMAIMYPNDLRMKPMQLEDADKINYDKVIEIYEKLYANPGSFTFTFVGTIDENELKPLVELYLGSLPSGNKDAKYTKRNATPQQGVHNKFFDKEMTTPKATYFCLYNTKIEKTTKNELAVSAFKQILDIVYTRTVREEEGGTYGVGAWGGIARIPEGLATMQMYFDCNPEVVDKLAPIIEREVKQIMEKGPEAEDFDKVKKYMLKKHQEDIKQNGYWLGTISDFGFYNEDDHTDYLSVLESLTESDVQNIAKSYLNSGNKIEVMMTPTK